MTPSLRKLVLASLPAILAVPVWATAASGAVLSCGQTITQSTVLDNDLTGCTNNGIVIGADNITLDLNGHTVAGTAATGDQAGVALVGRSGVTVKNGTVRAFDVGVVIEGGSGNTVQGVQANGNISFETTPNRRGGDGIAILSSRNNRIINTSAVNNGPYSGIGIYSEVDSAHPRATSGVSSGNVVDGNGLDGITLFVRNTFTTVRNNQVTNNGFYRQTARRGNGIGLQIGGANDNLVENNLSVRNADNGISVRNGSVRNVIRNNTAVQNALLPPASANFGPTAPVGGTRAHGPADGSPRCPPSSSEPDA